MNILVTGGAGFIGSHYVDLLIERGHSVWVVDKMTYAATAKNINPRVSGFQPWDMGNELVADLISYHGITQVVNFAAESHVDRSVKDPEAFLRTDILGVFNLVRSCRRARVERFVHVSTDEVYGPVPAGHRADEEWPLRPTSPYSASKAAADLILLAYHRTYGFPVVIVRPCNQYGPRQYPEKLIPMAITRTLRGQSVLVHGDGLEVREWMHVEDCCQLINTVRRKGNDGEIYNVGSGYRQSNSAILHFLSNAVNGVMTLEHVPNRPGNDARYALDRRKLQSVHPNHLFITFLEGLERTVEWYRENPGWWDGAVDWGSNIYHDNKDYLR